MNAESQTIDPLVWDDVKVFLALVRERTYKGAAARLGVVGSTVSRRLDTLEATLGQRLFDRTPEGALPTAAAERLMAHAERLEEAALGLSAAVSGLEQEATGMVRVSAPPGVLDVFVVPLLPAFYAAHPGIILELDGRIGYADLTRREADLALRAMRPSQGDLVTQKLVTAADAFFAAPELAAKAKRWKSLVGRPVITWDHDLAHIPSARWLAAAAPEARVVLRTSQVSAQLAAAQAGLGMIILPEPYERVPGLVRVSFGAALRRALPPAPQESLWLVGHRALREVPRVSAVWDLMVQGFTGRPAKLTRARAG